MRGLRLGIELRLAAEPDVALVRGQEERDGRHPEGRHRLLVAKVQGQLGNLQSLNTQRSRLPSGRARRGREIRRPILPAPHGHAGVRGAHVVKRDVSQQDPPGHCDRQVVGGDERLLRRVQCRDLEVRETDAKRGEVVIEPARIEPQTVSLFDERARIAQHRAANQRHVRQRDEQHRDHDGRAERNHQTTPEEWTHRHQKQPRALPLRFRVQPLAVSSIFWRAARA